MADRDGQVTQLLKEWSQGESAAMEPLVPLVYAELRRIAGGYLRRERPNHTLQPTGLVHEVYLRLGAGFWDGQSRQRLDQSFGTDVVTRSVDESGTGFLFGVGGGVTLGKAFHLRLDLQSVGIDEDVLNAREDSSIDSILLELQFRFGAH